MGISILIPVYNFPVDSLVRSLSAQLAVPGREGEIIILNDGSDPATVGNLHSLESLPGVKHYSNLTNKGRMAARLFLARKANHDYLLFLDGDSEITNAEFLNEYYRATEQFLPLVSGGRNYQVAEPSCEKRLHWKYGSKRESIHNPHGHAFMSNNFLVRKEIFTSLDHSFLLTGYGHEDSWWGMQFEKNGIKPTYIDNPVVHAALEDAERFLEKSIAALQNIRLLKQVAGEEEIKKNIRIYRVYKKLKKAGLASVFLFFEKPFHKMLRKNLLSCNPSLFYFDCYRLAALIRQERGFSGSSQSYPRKSA